MPTLELSSEVFLQDKRQGTICPGINDIDGRDITEALKVYKRVHRVLGNDDDFGPCMYGCVHQHSKLNWLNRLIGGNNVMMEIYQRRCTIAEQKQAAKYQRKIREIWRELDRKTA